LPLRTIFHGVKSSDLDWHRLDADPDPDLTFNFDADPDPDPTSSFTHVGKSFFRQSISVNILDSRVPYSIQYISIFWKTVYLALHLVEMDTDPDPNLSE
jgi:hypothetical protein